MTHALCIYQLLEEAVEARDGRGLYRKGSRQAWVKAGDHVVAGDAILTFSKDKVAKAGYKDIIMTIITNSDDLASIEKVAAGTVAAGDKIMQTS